MIAGAMRDRRAWGRWHVRIGWLAAIPLILWTATGLFMTSFPIEAVRGEGVVRDARPLAPAMLVGRSMPATVPPGTHMLSLRWRGDRPVWIASGPDGDVAFDPATGSELPALDASAAARLARLARVDRTVAVASLDHSSSDQPPIALRKARAAWRVRFVDGVDLYVDARSGLILATRTRLWRLYDLAWGLHILDPMGREDTHHPVLTLSALAAFATTVAGIVLLFRRRRDRADRPGGR